MTKDPKYLQHATELTGHGIVFFPTPKTASSSVKQIMYRMLHGKRFVERDEHGNRRRALPEYRDFFRTNAFDAIDHDLYRDHDRITLVRDPVERQISVYTGIAGNAGALAEDKIDMELAAALELKPNPNANAYFSNLERYRVLAGPIWAHSNPVTVSLGTNLAYFTHVFRLSEFDDMIAFMSEKSGLKAKKVHANKSTGDKKKMKKKAKFEDLSRKAQKNLLAHCAGDYALLNGYFSNEKYLDIMTSMV